MPERGGVLYPRAGALGGCTAHNAMIFVYPHNQDWDDIAALTGDPILAGGQHAPLFRACSKIASIVRLNAGSPVRLGSIRHAMASAVG